MEKEKWIEQIIDSTDGIAKAIPDHRLFAKIQNRIKEQEVVSPQWIWLAAASLALLFLLNAKMVFGKNKNSKASAESVASSLSSSNQLY
jgi:hypothetical protein